MKQIMMERSILIHRIPLMMDTVLKLTIEGSRTRIDECLFVEKSKED